MKLKWSLNELRAYNNSMPLEVQGSIDLEKSLTQRSNVVLKSDPVGIKGYIIVESENEFIVSMTLSVNLVMPSSRSLDPVDVDLKVPFHETYLAPGFSSGGNPSDEEIITELENEWLDLVKPIEDAILSSLPTQVFTEEEKNGKRMPEGNSWKVISEDAFIAEENKEVESKDSPFASLKDLFDEE